MSDNGRWVPLIIMTNTNTNDVDLRNTKDVTQMI